MPCICGYVEDAEGTSSTEPALCHFFEILEAVYHVSLGIFVREVEKMDGACSVGNVDGDVADLFQSISSFVYAQQLGNSCGSLRAYLAR